MQADQLKECIRRSLAEVVNYADELRDLLHSGEGPLFIHARVDADDQPRVIPSRDGVAIKHRFMQAIGTLA